MSNRMKADLVNKALLMAIWRLKPAKGLIFGILIEEASMPQKVIAAF
jgi:transposase InsO family protein